MTPEEKVKAYFYMNGRDAPDFELFDSIIHDDILQIDAPAGIRVEGKQAVWAGMNIPAEHKQGPDAFAYGADFIDYVGDEQKGFARWWFQPTGKFAFLWGKTDLTLSAEESPEIVIAVAVEFKDGKIFHLEEYWNPTPLLQKFGFDIPSPGIPQ